MEIVFAIMLVASFVKERYLDEEEDFGDIVAGFLGGFASVVLYIPADAFLN